MAGFDPRYHHKSDNPATQQETIAKQNQNKSNLNENAKLLYPDMTAPNTGAKNAKVESES